MSEDLPTVRRRGPVVVLTSNKGGVGKTTVAANLAIYLRALLEQLPVLVVGLDDQHSLDRMFALREYHPADGNLKHGWAERCLDRVIQLGEYGVHFVPSPPDGVLLKARAADPRTLRRILDCTEWDGLVILDTKSDLEALTQNAIHAADRILVPVSDRAALLEAERLFRLLERSGIPAARARVVLTLADRRTRVDGGRPLIEHLADELRRRRWPRYRTALSRSPRVEALASGGGRPLSILHHATGTSVHREMRELAEELIRDLDLGAWAGAASPPARASDPRARRLVGALRGALLRGIRVR